MTNADTIKLKNVDSLDIDDVLRKVEKSFQIHFGKEELKDVKTFGELCDIIVDKIELENVEDCTTQQAFYKLRNAICETQRINHDSINIDTDLKTIFPRYLRRKKIKEVENYLGFSFKILRPKHWVTFSFVLIFLTSLIGLYFNWQLGLIGIMFMIVGNKVANKVAKEINLKTVGELTEKISRENYLNSRRNAATVNRKEVVDKIRNLFIHDLYLSSSVLTREATFI